uniref:Uncharacterized protein n=1 Tax=Anguilla anguilla TaxID=7936 RepID=A0A0E9WTZ3_ANGAN
MHTYADYITHKATVCQRVSASHVGLVDHQPLRLIRVSSKSFPVQVNIQAC